MKPAVHGVAIFGGSLSAALRISSRTIFAGAKAEAASDAADLAELTKALDLRNAVHIGHSTGGGEVIRYVARHGKGRVAKAVIISAIPAGLLKTGRKPNGVPMEVFDGLRDGTANHRSRFYQDITIPFYGYNRPGAKISQGLAGHRTPRLWRPLILLRSFPHRAGPRLRPNAMTKMKR